jgi:hypothetical protein
MDFGGPEFVITIIAISTFGWLASTWIRARHGYPVENEWSGMVDHPDTLRRAEGGKIELLSSENDRLKSHVGQLEERLKVLERIATDPSRELASEIDKLNNG